MYLYGISRMIKNMIQENYISFKFRKVRVDEDAGAPGLKDDIVFFGLCKKLRERYKKNRCFSSMDKIKYSFKGGFCVGEFWRDKDAKWFNFVYNPVTNTMNSWVEQI